MSDKIAYNEMKFLYESAYQTAMNALFKQHFEKHGWRYDDFMEAYSTEEELIDFVIDPHATIH